MEIPKLATAPDHPVIRAAIWFTTIALGAVILYLLTRLFLPNNWSGGLQTVASTVESSTFWTAVLVGLLAQTVDGALGMAYGVTASTFLLGMGASPAVASASVHIAEIFTTGVSGIAHARFGNVEPQAVLATAGARHPRRAARRGSGHPDRRPRAQALRGRVPAAHGPLHPE